MTAANAGDAPPSRWRLDALDFELPASRIALHPAAERSAARLLDGRAAPPVDRHVRDLASLLAPGDLLVLNDTRVVKARLRGRKASGGAFEALVERVLPDDRTVWAHVRASKAPRAGQRLVVDDAAGRPAFEAEVLGRAGDDGSLFVLRLPSAAHALLDAHGAVPLPPYIEAGREPQADDRPSSDLERYQSLWAARPGAVAAPTASLHFDAALLQALAARGVATAHVTLHVGAGTFQPVRAARLEDHPMHRERIDVGAAAVQAIAQARARGGRVVAVGTTVLRALESAALAAEGLALERPLAWLDAPAAAAAPLAAWQGESALLVLPGYRFRVVDRLLTNFHLPRSTLLMLVAAFAGEARVRALYRHAIDHGYRFYSYGDAMLLDAAPTDAAPTDAAPTDASATPLDAAPSGAGPADPTASAPDGAPSRRAPPEAAMG